MNFFALPLLCQKEITWEMNLATWDETCDSRYPTRSEAFNTKIGLSIGAVIGCCFFIV